MSTNCEIERKFLVWWPLQEILKLYPDHQALHISQQYLLESGNWTTRIREIVLPDRSEHWLTLKKSISSVSCVEIETLVDKRFYEQMSQQCGACLKKVRYKIDHFGTIWEIDYFLHPVFGNLVVAEIELDSEEEEFVKPVWLSKEVTHQKKYKNAKMVRFLNKYATDVNIINPYITPLD